MAAGLLDKKESEDSSSVIGPSMLEPEPSHTEVRATVAFPRTLLLMLSLKAYRSIGVIMHGYTLHQSIFFCVSEIRLQWQQDDPNFLLISFTAPESFKN